MAAFRNHEVFLAAFLQEGGCCRHPTCLSFCESSAGSRHSFFSTPGEYNNNNNNNYTLKSESLFRELGEWEIENL